MRTKLPNLSAGAAGRAAADSQTKVALGGTDVPPPEAFLEEARTEPKRKLILDHIKTIYLLRDEKKFTFRDIAAWLTKRGFETDHSAVYRAYLSAIPEGHPDRDMGIVDPEES